ncbi:hypothetical protein D3C87_2115050 [compost metagenome]
MRQPREALGRMAAEALIDILEEPETLTTPLKIVLRSELVVRESTARLAGGDANTTPTGERFS